VASCLSSTYTCTMFPRLSGRVGRWRVRLGNIRLGVLHGTELLPATGGPFQAPPHPDATTES
jgi:hypothetical protein